MALGSVAISGGMSKKAKERMMYMDGKPHPFSAACPAAWEV